MPARTAQRWHARLATAALALAEPLRRAGAVLLAGVTAARTREELVGAYAAVHTVAPGARLAAVAAAVHRGAPGVRLM